jgi:hypothetical protein
MMNDQLFDNPFVLQSATVDQDDIDQEIALLELQGITVNRRIVRMRMMQRTEGLFQGEPGLIAQPMEVRSLPSDETVDDLLDWAIEQSAEITRLVLDFLAEPDDDRLENVVQQLSAAGLIKGSTKGPRGNLTETMLHYIAEKPRSKEDLYAYARTMHNTRRPEATVRQFLRRAVRSNQLAEIDGLYHVQEA